MNSGLGNAGMTYNPDKSLLDQYRAMHDAGHFKGMSILKHVLEIADLVRETNTQTLLDYGCGSGNQYSVGECHLYWGGILPSLYDPASSNHNKRPDCKFDGVICTDVAEHIPENEIDDFLNDVFGYANKFVFITICTRPAKKSLPDGRNAHLTVKPKEWWIDKIKSVGVNYPGLEVAIDWNDT